MATIYPIKALRPQHNLAARVASVPYDVVNRLEAKNLVQDNRHSFLHVTKPEIDLATNVDAYSDEVYTQGRTALDRLISEGTLVRDDQEHYFIYALTMNNRTQTGYVILASVEDYEQEIVKKHELTRPDKEEDRVKNITALNAQSGTVFLLHRPDDCLSKIITHTKQSPPIYDFTTNDGIRHELWQIESNEQQNEITNAFAKQPALYIADGHHRSAAAAKVAQKLRGTPDHHKYAERFLAVSFSADELLILDYNRAVKDLNGHTPEAFLEKLEDRFEVSSGQLEHPKPHHFEMYLAGSWYTLSTRNQVLTNSRGPISSLDVSILQTNILSPLLGIEDPRTDNRIAFIGGIRGRAELEKRVHEDCVVAFKLHPTSVEDLLNVADAGEIMPPKSTWFEPKLRDGLIIHLLSP